MKEYIKPEHPHNYIIDHFNYINLLTYAAAAGKAIKIYTRTRHYIGDYKAIDQPNAPIILKSFFRSGGIIYSRSGYNTKSISYDDITRIVIL